MLWSPVLNGGGQLRWELFRVRVQYCIQGEGTVLMNKVLQGELHHWGEQSMQVNKLAAGAFPIITSPVRYSIMYRKSKKSRGWSGKVKYFRPHIKVEKPLQ